MRDSSSPSASDPEIERRDGWSKRRVDGKSVSRCSLNHADNSVAPIESSPTDTRDASTEISVPVSLVAILETLLMRLSGELAH